MPDADMLFQDYPDPDQPEPERLSAGRRLTLRQRADVDRGVHPLTRLPIIEPREHTCGDCSHHHPVRDGNAYPKCDTMPYAASAANDCRAWWPACTGWEPDTR